MKCIIKINTDKIYRVKDKRAHQLVNSGTHRFTPKWMWKEQQGLTYRGTKLPPS